MKRKLGFSCLTGVLLFCLSFFNMSMSVYAAYGGDGSEENPYQISSQEDLQEMFDNMVEAMIDDESLNGYYIMTNDITISEPLNTSVLDSYLGKDGYTIGSKRFSGVFSGGGHTIQGLAIADSSGKSYNLFEVNDGTIQDLGITLQTSGAVQYSDSPLVGSNKGVIKNCTVYGTMTKKLSALNESIGMIADSNNGVIQDCAVSGKLNVSSVGKPVSNIGGIVGSNERENGYFNGGHIINCKSSVDIVVNAPASDASVRTGGIAGWNGGEISGCSAETFQMVSLESPKASTLDPYNYILGGGIAGANGTGGSITKCTASGSLYASSYFPAKINLGGILGSGDGTASDNTNNIGMIEKDEEVAAADPSRSQEAAAQNLAPDGKPNCILCGNTGERTCQLCHGEGTVISGAFMEGGWTGDGWVGKTECQLCNGTGKLDCYCGR